MSHSLACMHLEDEMRNRIEALPIEVELFARRARFYNDVIGVLSVSLAFGALGTEAPRFYALLGMLFVIMLMARHGKQYERIFKLWRETNHQLVQVRWVWKSYLVFLVGFLGLAAVAIGLLNKSGIVGLA